ncbi:MAG: hypothetical protein ACOCVD_02850 [Bacillota bacterium]
MAFQTFKTPIESLDLLELSDNEIVERFIEEENKAGYPNGLLLAEVLRRKIHNKVLEKKKKSKK